MKMSIVAFERFFAHLIRGLIDELGSEALSEDILACFLGALFSWVFHCCGHLCSWILFIVWALRSRRFLLRVWVHLFCFVSHQVHCPFASSLVRHIWPPLKLSPMFLLASQVHPPLCMGVMQIWLPLPHPFPVNPHHLISLILCPHYIPMRLSLTPPTNPFSLSPTISIPRPIKPAPFHQLSPSMPFTSIPSCPKLPNTHACCHLFSLYTLSYTHFCSCPSYPFSTMHGNHSSITVFIPIIPVIQSHGSLPVYACRDHTPMDSPHSDAKPFFS